MRTIRNRFLDEKTARDIDAQVGKILRGLGNPVGPINLAEVRELLKLDRQFYSSKDESVLREVVSKVKIAGKQVLARPSLILDVVRKFDLKALWVPDRKRIMLDSTQPEAKWRWNETHEIIHSVVPWHEGAMMGDDAYSLTPACHEQTESEANYGAGRLLFLQDLFNEFVRGSQPSIELVQDAKTQFGNTLTTSFWRLVENLEIRPETPVSGRINPWYQNWFTMPLHGQVDQTRSVATKNMNVESKKNKRPQESPVARRFGRLWVSTGLA